MLAKTSSIVNALQDKVIEITIIVSRYNIYLPQGKKNKAWDTQGA